MNTEPKQKKEDKNLDLTLRPQRWDEYVGQKNIKDNLKILIEAAKKREQPIEHVLLYGPPGLGKTSLAHLIAREMNTNIRVTSGPAIERVGDLASILTNLMPGDILFVDEAHRLNKMVEEILYPAMESRTLDIIIGKGPSAKTIQLDLPPFTLIAATTRIGLLSGPLRSRFGAIFRLDFYTETDIQKILERSTSLLGIRLDNDAKKIIAQSSRFTPRVSNRLLKRVRDWAEVYGSGHITREAAESALTLLEVDQLGLEPTDRKIIDTTGAGDAFGSGFVCEFMKSGDIEKSIQLGMANSVANLAQVGAKNGLLKKGQEFRRVPVTREECDNDVCIVK